MKYLRFIDPTTQAHHWGYLPDQTSDDRVEVLSQAPWHPNSQPIGVQVYLAEVIVAPPAEPSKIVCVGKNYKDHIAEMTGITGDGTVPQEPLLFFKPPSALLKPQGDILYPQQSQQVDYEGELAVIVGKPCQQVEVQAVSERIFGYTIANDVTARDLQKKDSQWVRAKGFDTFCPLGPWIVPSISTQARLQTHLNGTLVQSATLDQMIFSVEVVISYISQILTLLPGDLILTGTPSGIGPMHPDDEVSVSIEGIGLLTNRVKSGI